MLSRDFTAVCATLQHSAMPVPLDDNIHVIAEMGDGVAGVISSERFCPVPGDLTEFYGTEGSLHLIEEATTVSSPTPLAVFVNRRFDDLPADIRAAWYPRSKPRRMSGGGFDGWIALSPPRNDPYATQIEVFADLISGRKPRLPSASGLDGLRANEFVLASHMSMIERRWVDLPLSPKSEWIVPSFE
ncbi:hypothetical protein [Mesorhizobium sp. B2-4-15]|uniref:Gfo/Idh/MocA family protein n=1 Tax=Mesorhizobium sp. B2-4-15 TaxID=2589934 RepID=UPI0032B19E89